MSIDRCICFNITFRELAAHAREHGGGLEALRARFGCGRGCALCVPYIRAMLASGQTSFDPAAPLPSPPDEQAPSCEAPAGGGAD